MRSISSRRSGCGRTRCRQFRKEYVVWSGVAGGCPKKVDMSHQRPTPALESSGSSGVSRAARRSTFSKLRVLRQVQMVQSPVQFKPKNGESQTDSLVRSPSCLPIMTCSLQESFLSLGIALCSPQSLIINWEPFLGGASGPGPSSQTVDIYVTVFEICRATHSCS